LILFEVADLTSSGLSSPLNRLAFNPAILKRSFKGGTVFIIPTKLAVEPAPLSPLFQETVILSILMFLTAST
jgi:hypothetical protein